MKRSSAVGFLVASALASAPAAAAPDDRTRAAEAYQRGVAAHDRGDLQAAAKEFALADAIAPNPTALRAALDAALDADDPALGAELLERAKRGPVEGALATSVEAARKKLGGRAGRVRVACPERATCLATLDGAPMPIETPVWTRTGQHTVVVQVDDAPRTKLVTVAADEVVVVAPPGKTAEEPRPAAPVLAPVAPENASPTPTPTQAPEPAPASSGLPKTVVLVTGAATVAAGALTLVWGSQTANAHEDFVASGCQSTGFPGCAETKSDGQALQTRTNVMIGVTGGLALASVVIGVFFTDWSGRGGGRGRAMGPGPAPVGARAFVTPAPGGAAFGWSGGF